MINNPLGMRVNMRVSRVVRVLLEFEYAISQLKNLEGKDQQLKKRRKDT